MRAVQQRSFARGTFRYGRIETPLGAGFVVYGPRGTILLSARVSEASFRREVLRAVGSVPERADPPPPLARRLAAAMARGDGSGADLSGLSPFQRRVLETTARIPHGSVRSYGWVARRIGRPAAARAVARALATNPIPFIVPCHRVIREDGSLAGYGLGGTATKRRLLEAEGARLAARRSG